MPEPTAPSRWESSATFVRGVFSDGGVPSSSRILTFILAIADVIIIGCVVRHLCKLTDPATLAVWLANLPMVIAGLVGLASMPYAINRASGSISDIISSLRKG